MMDFGIALEHKFTDRRTPRNRNEQSRTAKNPLKSLQLNCIATICRRVERQQQLQQSHAPKRRATK